MCCRAPYGARCSSVNWARYLLRMLELYDQERGTSLTYDLADVTVTHRRCIRTCADMSLTVFASYIKREATDDSMKSFLERCKFVTDKGWTYFQSVSRSFRFDTGIDG